MYIFMVLSSLAEVRLYGQISFILAQCADGSYHPIIVPPFRSKVAVASWLLIQFSANANYPNTKAHNAVKTLLHVSLFQLIGNESEKKKRVD